MQRKKTFRPNMSVQIFRVTHSMCCVQRRLGHLRAARPASARTGYSGIGGCRLGHQRRHVAHASAVHDAVAAHGHGRGVAGGGEGVGV